MATWPHCICDPLFALAIGVKDFFHHAARALLCLEAHLLTVVLYPRKSAPKGEHPLDPVVLEAVGQAERRWYNAKVAAKDEKRWGIRMQIRAEEAVKKFDPMFGNFVDLGCGSLHHEKPTDWLVIPVDSTPETVGTPTKSRCTSKHLHSVVLKPRSQRTPSRKPVQRMAPVDRTKPKHMDVSDQQSLLSQDPWPGRFWLRASLERTSRGWLSCTTKED